MNPFFGFKYIYNYRMRVLNLFSRNKNVYDAIKLFTKNDEIINVINVDKNPNKCLNITTDINVDIMSWDYSNHYYDVIIAHLPFNAKQKLILKVREIILDLKPNT